LHKNKIVKVARKRHAGEETAELLSSRNAPKHRIESSKEEYDRVLPGKNPFTVKTTCRTGDLLHDKA